MTKPSMNKMIKASRGCILAFIIFNSIVSQGQTKWETINSNWLFYKGNIPEHTDKFTGWEMVSLPHSWNTVDVLDDQPDYYRGSTSYKKTIYLGPSYQDKKVFLYFEGINQTAEVYVNGKLAGKHSGGYTRFCFPISHLLKLDSGKQNSANEILIKADNSHNEDIPPLSADFTFFGGIYRDVYLVSTNQIHFDLSDHASLGTFITTPTVAKEKATINVRGTVVNAFSATKKIIVDCALKDAEGKVVLTQRQTINAKAGEKTIFTLNLNLATPRLWSPEDPYLYSVSVRLLAADKSGLVWDDSVLPLGVRWFSFDPEKGFFLNGESYKLVGASRHQDYKNMANALPDALHYQDVKLLKEMGANFLRVAHYPQDPAVLQACDKMGILTSVEIPVVNNITESEAFTENCKTMQIEMIKQNFNHPSVIIWAYMNEVLLRPRFNNDPDRQKVYFTSIATLAQTLENITRREDPSRYTMIPNHGAFSRYKEVGLTEIPMLVGWNLYQGWYSEDMLEFPKFLDRHRKELPHKPMLVTEYGADADPRLRSFEPVRFDMSAEYANRYHTYYFQEMMKRPFVAGFMLWNFADFSSETRADAVPHFNNKGITGIERTPKDSYYYYQSQLAKTPYIKIASRNWRLRTGIADESSALTCTQPLEVYANTEKVELHLNGHKVEEKTVVDKLVTFNTPFQNGMNTIEVITLHNGTTYKDIATVEFQLLPSDFSNIKNSFHEINISLGDKRFFINEALHQIWLPDQPYKKGSYGYIGGKVFSRNNGRQGYGSDKNIRGTNNDPVYQTQIIGIEKYKVDVPPGVYEVTLHFAELLSNENREPLAYMLDTKIIREESEARAFDVKINGKLILENINNTEQLLPATVYAEKIIINVENNGGLEISFDPKIGQPILNGLQIKKIY